MTEAQRRDRLARWRLALLALLPLVVLALLLWAFVQLQPLRALTGNAPPLEQLSIERFELGPQGIVAHVVNGGPEPVQIAQVIIDEAYWHFEQIPPGPLARLGRATLHVPYPWVEAEAHKVTLLTSTGLTFSRTVEVALATPQPDAGFWLMFALLGAYVGIVPVGLGLLWFPMLKQLGRTGLNFVLALTVGLLVFLLVDTVLEGIEIAQEIPEVFQAVPLVFLVGLLSFLILMSVSRRKDRSGHDGRGGRLWLATSIALGIGLHNLGEGMAIGAAVALGEAALGAFLVVGFTLHNITEGLGIGAPIVRDKPGFWRLLALALLAGGPAIVGTWIGGFAFSPLWAVLFLAVGAGAILQVVYEVTRLLISQAGERQSAFSWSNVAGLTTGIAVMYLTALLVKF